jgi:hypothetical protein
MQPAGTAPPALLAALRARMAAHASSVRVAGAARGAAPGSSPLRSPADGQSFPAAGHLRLRLGGEPIRFPPRLLTVGDWVAAQRAVRPARSKRAFMVLAYRQSYRCAHCGLLLHPDSEADHVVPWSLTGDDADRNLQVLCPNCHAAKSSEEASRLRRARAVLLRLQRDGRGELEGLCWGCMGVRSVFFPGCAACGEAEEGAAEAAGAAPAAWDDAPEERTGLRAEGEGSPARHREPPGPTPPPTPPPTPLSTPTRRRGRAGGADRDAAWR